jgi:hypothetical protein
MQEHLAYGDGVLNARLPMDTDRPKLENGRSVSSQIEDFPYVPIPQTPPVDAAECTVTVNFPDMQLLDSAFGSHPPAYPSTPRDQDL